MSEEKTDIPEMTEQQLTLYNRLTPLQRPIVIAELLDQDRKAAYFKAGGKGKGHSVDMYCSRLINDNQKAIEFLNSMRCHNLSKEIIGESIASKEEVLEKLTLILRTNNQVRNQIAAVRELRAMQGWDAPVKSQIEVPKGISHKYTAEDYHEADDIIREHFNQTSH